MAIEYSLNKVKNVYELEVEQTTTYTLYYNGVVVETKEIFADFIVKPKFTVDGSYRLVLEAVGEGDEEILIDIYTNLIDSIIKDAIVWLCNCSCNCSDNCNCNCITADARKALNHRITLNKLIIFQSYYLESYLSSSKNDFNAFIETNIQNNTCTTQETINTLLMQECIEGKVKNSDRIFRLHLALFWLAIYELEFAFIESSQEERDFLKERFCYDLITKCICDLCITVTAPDPPDTGGGTTPDPQAVVYQWQFENDLITDISFAPTINQAYLDAQTVVNTNTAEQGYNLTLTARGRIGFAVQGKGQSFYNIFDQFNQDITDTVFDTYYNSELDTEIYITKEFYSPSTIYFKFIQN